ncbi:hypothetical protein [Nonomuraea bangladeshensis]|uniref:hypothetical protein n=1 Tax=Nonomuraea bangladeshensis TaxID=404385 RepID=UPI003C2D5312
MPCPDGVGPLVAAAIDRFLASLPAKTTRDSYAKTLTHLAARAGNRPVADLSLRGLRSGHGPLDHRGGRHLEPAPVRPRHRPRPGMPPRPRHSKGGAIEYVHWATATARLLPRLLQGRQAGPVFLADRRAPASGPRARHHRHLPVTGRGRLSYPRAEYLFKTATAALDPHHEGWTLHQLRHSALQHLAEAGRTAPELQAKFRRQSLASLGRYVRLGEKTSARITAEQDPAARRRKR